MRVRTVNEKAVAKTLAFLKEVYKISGSPVIKSISLLYSEHGISKATGPACVQLGIFEVNEREGRKWLTTEPDRAMAIKVLELLRRRNDKMVAVPLEGFEQLLMDLKEIVKNSKPKVDARRDVGNYEKQIADKKHDDFIKIVCAIATNYPWNIIGGYHPNLMEVDIDNVNQSIVKVSKDLLTKIYK